MAAYNKGHSFVPVDVTRHMLGPGSNDDGYSACQEHGLRKFFTHNCLDGV